jgi:hypothetical protein
MQFRHNFRLFLLVFWVWILSNQLLTVRKTYNLSEYTKGGVGSLRVLDEFLHCYA